MRRVSTRFAGTTSSAPNANPPQGRGHAFSIVLGHRQKPYPALREYPESSIGTAQSAQSVPCMPIPISYPTVAGKQRRESRGQRSGRRRPRIAPCRFGIGRVRCRFLRRKPSVTDENRRIRPHETTVAAIRHADCSREFLGWKGGFREADRSPWRRPFFSFRPLDPAFARTLLGRSFHATSHAFQRTGRFGGFRRG